jgi:hypothetical protein
LLLADGFHAKAAFFNLLLAHGKHARMVLRDERRDLYQDADGLFAVTPPEAGKYRSRQCQWWDVSDLPTGPQVNAPCGSSLARNLLGAPPDYEAGRVDYDRVGLGHDATREAGSDRTSRRLRASSLGY